MVFIIFYAVLAVGNFAAALNAAYHHEWEWIVWFLFAFMWLKQTTVSVAVWKRQRALKAQSR